MFAERSVAYVAAFEEWLPVDNVPALFETEAQGEIRASSRGGRDARTSCTGGRGPWRCREARRSSAAITCWRSRRCRRAVTVDNKSSQIWYLFGIALGSADRAPDAEQAFRRSVALYPDWADAREALISTLASLGKPITAADLGTGAPSDTVARAR